MTRPEDRQTLIDAIVQARAAGARLAPLCELASLDVRTLQRWHAGDGRATADRRPDAQHAPPSHALSQAERARIVVIASEASFRRVLRAHGQMH